MKQDVIDSFAAAYSRKPSAFSRAPGRLEILGNHTDYNEGYVLSCATGQATEMATEEYGSLIFVLAPGAFIVLGYLIAIVNKIRKV